MKFIYVTEGGHITAAKGSNIMKDIKSFWRFINGSKELLKNTIIVINNCNSSHSKIYSRFKQFPYTDAFEYGNSKEFFDYFSR